MLLRFTARYFVLLRSCFPVKPVHPCAEVLERIWLPPRDSNPDNLLQRQVS